MRLHYKKAERKRGQEAILAILEQSASSAQQECLHAVRTVRQKLYRLEQEIKLLEADGLIGAGISIITLVICRLVIKSKAG